MISLESVTRIYERRGNIVTALDDVSLQVDRGQLVFIQGPSGCGKTTLLMTIGGMLRPNSGQVCVNNQELYVIGGGARAAFRSQHIGFVFQSFHLVPYLNVLDNVLLAGGGNGARRTDATELIERLNLSHRIRHKPAELSAGERQRAAIARATLARPEVLLADEPTGNLDNDSAAEVFNILSGYRDDGGTVLVVTHGTTEDARPDHVIRMQQGRVLAENAVQ
jgi:putative ABC transport system ATP-binding protein